MRLFRPDYDRARAETGLILRLPAVSENPQPPPIQPAEPAESDQTLPINLATALYLSNARPLVIAFAQASVEEAAARLQGAQVLWLPNLNVGTDYYRHEGTDQSTDGTIILDDKMSFAAGGGATLNFGITDAIFRPLADRQELAARQADLQTARNDALLAVALAYFDVQQARGTLAGTLDAVAKANVLVQKTAGLARGLVPEIEVDRARALLFDLQQQAAASRANWRIASARLTRTLRLNPSAVVVPVEPPHLQVTLISTGRRVCDLIPVGLANRPELTVERALVEASMQRVRQERFRPLIPSVVMQGAGPDGFFNGGVFGGGPDDSRHLYGGRFDAELGAVWTLSNLGAGNRRWSTSGSRRKTRLRSLLPTCKTKWRRRSSRRLRKSRPPGTGQLCHDGGSRGDHHLQRHAQGNCPDQQAPANCCNWSIVRRKPLLHCNNWIGLMDSILRLSTPTTPPNFNSIGHWAFPARTLLCDRPLGDVQPVDTSRPPGMAPGLPTRSLSPLMPRGIGSRPRIGGCRLILLLCDGRVAGCRAVEPLI